MSGLQEYKSEMIDRFVLPQAYINDDPCNGNRRGVIYENRSYPHICCSYFGRSGVGFCRRRGAPAYPVAKTSVQQQQEGCPDAAKNGKKMKTGKKTQNDEQNEKNYDRVLLGIYG